MKRTLKYMLGTTVVIMVLWTALTVWAEMKGPKKSWLLPGSESAKHVLIVYDPDPIYNLDEQVCRSFAQGLSDKGVAVNVATVSAAEEMTLDHFDVYVFCSNTYNWRPDWAITRFIDNLNMKNKSAVAITLGSGSTEASQKKLESLIVNKEAKLIDSRSMWLMRPNDDTKMKQSNVAVANSMIYKWALDIAEQIQSDSLKQTD